MDWCVCVCVCVYEVIRDKLENRNLQRETMETSVIHMKECFGKKRNKTSIKSNSYRVNKPLCFVAFQRVVIPLCK